MDLGLQLRIMKSTKIVDGCWIWQKYTTKHGYGHLKIKGKMWRAHRASYLAFNDNLPELAVVRHKCHNKNCVNPKHLELGTHAQNLQDTYRTGNSKSAKLTYDQVLDIKDLIKDGLTLKSIADMYGVNYYTIRDIKRGHRWSYAIRK